MSATANSKSTPTASPSPNPPGPHRIPHQSQRGGGLWPPRKAKRQRADRAKTGPPSPAPSSPPPPPAPSTTAAPEAAAHTRSESLFNALDLFGLARLLYLAAFLLAITSWLVAPPSPTSTPPPSSSPGSESDSASSPKRLTRDGILTAASIYGVVCFVLLFSFVGTILGGLIRARGLAVLAILGNIVTAFSWFGTNLLGIDLHSYGFTETGFLYLAAFTTTQFAITLLALKYPTNRVHPAELNRSNV